MQRRSFFGWIAGAVGMLGARECEAKSRTPSLSEVYEKLNPLNNILPEHQGGDRFDFESLPSDVRDYICKTSNFPGPPIPSTIIDQGLIQWQLPFHLDRYYMAVVVGSYGKGMNTAVITIHRLGLREFPDVQVAQWRGMFGDSGSWVVSERIRKFSRDYNDCEVAIDCACDHGLRIQQELMAKGFSNFYRWKVYEEKRCLEVPGWMTNARTASMLTSTFIMWCRERLIVIKSRDFLFSNDVIKANMICLFCHHDSDFNVEKGRPEIPVSRS
jgi:hypothetical protein